jgi:hypothetical protein
VDLLIRSDRIVTTTETRLAALPARLAGLPRKGRLLRGTIEATVTRDHPA